MRWASFVGPGFDLWSRSGVAAASSGRRTTGPSDRLRRAGRCPTRAPTCRAGRPTPASTRRSSFPLEHVTSVFPAQGATGVCTDAPLRLFFDTPPTTGAGGTVKVFDAADATTPVDSFDIAAPLTFQMIGGRNYFYKPIIISGNEAYIYLRKVLKPGETYYVTIDPGVFTDGFGGPPIGAVTDPTTWRFTVRSAPPAAGASRVAVTRRRLGRLLHGAGRDRLRPGRQHDAGDDQRRAGAPTARSSRSRPRTTSRPRRGSERRPSSHTRTTPRCRSRPGQTTSMGTKWRAMVGVDGSNDIDDREHHAVESQPAAVDQRPVRDAARRGRPADDRAQRDYQGPAGHAADVRAGLRRGQHHRGRHRLHLGQRRRLLRSLRDQGRRAQGLQRPGAQRDRARSATSSSAAT